jgi:predicted ATPase/DNA-binding SARP family transcriptional activator
MQKVSTVRQLVDMKDIPKIEIKLLGGFSILIGGNLVPEENWRLRKVRNLVKLLALAPNHQMHREQLIDLLWPDSDFKSALNMFYQTLHQARKGLDPYGQQCLVYQNEILSFAREIPLMVDVDDFRVMAAQVQQGADPIGYQAALQIYKGDLLPEDVYEEWAQPQRDALREEYLSLCEAFSDILVSRKEYSQAVEVLRKAVQLDASREASQSRLMYAYAVSSQRHQALRQYQVLQEALKHDLDIEPDARTTRLYEDILANRIAVDEPPRQLWTSSNAIRPKHNLPAQITSFIGREKEISEVTVLLQDHRLVTLTSFGGAGKTRLALKVAEDLLEQYQNGVWFVELAGLGNPEMVSRTIASVLGLQEVASRSLLEHLQDYLKEKELLLILDNCEHVISDVASIVDVLLRSCPMLKVLASSREAFGILGEIAYSVPSLNIPDGRDIPPVKNLIEYSAIQLFVERAVVSFPGFQLTDINAKAIVEICCRLDGIPLAIELAAARASVLTPEQIAARLNNRFRLLTGGSRTALPRHQTLQASIDWSYSLLIQEERTLLLRLSVFYGGWTLAAAGEVCSFDGLDEFDVIEGLAQLVNKSLIMMETGVDGSIRYSMLETIRQYANEKLLESRESDIVRSRHLGAFVSLAMKSEPHLRSHQQVEWMDHLETEIDNLRAALEWAMEGDVLEGLSLATSIFWFWFIRGYRVEGEQWLRKLLDWVDRKTLSLQGKMLVAEARARQSLLLSAFGAGSENATRIAEDAMNLAKELGEPGKPIQLIALHALQWNLSYHEENQAREISLKGLALAEELDDQFMVAEFLQHFDDDPDRARWKIAAEKNLAIRRALGDLDGQMTATIILAGHYFDSGDVTNARALFEESFQIACKVKNPWGIFVSQCNLAYTLCETGDLDRGMDLLVQLLPVTRDLGESHWVIWVLNALGHSADLKHDWPSCQAYYQQAIDLAHTSRLINAEIVSLINMAEAARKNGDDNLARQNYQSVAAFDHHKEVNLYGGAANFSRAMMAILDGDLPSATKLIHQASKAFLRRGNLTEIAHIHDYLVVLYAQQAGQADLVARLHGAIDRARPRYDDWEKMLFLARIDLAAQLAPTRTALGETEYERLYEEGKSMSVEQAVALIFGPS